MVSLVADGDKSFLMMRVEEQGRDKASPITHERLREIDGLAIDGSRIRPLVFETVLKSLVALISRTPCHSAASRNKQSSFAVCEERLAESCVLHPLKLDCVAAEVGDNFSDASREGLARQGHFTPK